MGDEGPPPAGQPPDAGDKVSNELSTGRLPEPAGEAGEFSPRDFLVLVVDDEVDNAVVISINLQQEGYRVITASDGGEAVRVAAQTGADIILMDIGMPGLDGLGAARKIRERGASRFAPIIAVTAYGTGGFQRAAHDAGFDGFVTKPIDFDRLRDLMRALLSNKVNTLKNSRSE